MNESFRMLVDDIQSFTGCKKSILTSSNEEVTWLPLIYFNNGSLVLGLNMQGKWVIESKQGLTQLDKPLSFTRTLSLLEDPIDVIRKQIHQKIDSDELRITIEHIFPFIDIIRIGMETGSEYWAILAFHWFDELSVVEQQQLIGSLEVVSRARWASQKLRHRAIRELRKLKPSQVQ